MNTSLYVEKLTQICLFFSMTLTFSTNCLFFSFFFPLWFDVHHSITDHRNIHFLFYFIFENLWEAGQFLIFFDNKSMSMAVFLSSFNTGAIYHLELSGNLCFWWLTDNSLFLSRCVPAMPCFVHSNVRLGLDCFIHVQSCLRLFNSGLKLFNSVAKLFEAQSGPSPIWMCLFNFVLFFFSTNSIKSSHSLWRMDRVQFVVCVHVGISARMWDYLTLNICHLGQFRLFWFSLSLSLSSFLIWFWPIWLFNFLLFFFLSLSEYLVVSFFSALLSCLDFSSGNWSFSS